MSIRSKYDNRVINGRNYLMFEGKRASSREVLERTKRRINKKIEEEGKRIANEIVRLINYFIRSLVVSYPDPTYSVWQDYVAKITNEQIVKDEKGFTRYRCDILVEKIKGRYDVKFNLWEALDAGGPVTFYEPAKWVKLTRSQLEPDDVSLRIYRPLFVRDRKGRLIFQTRPEGPITINYKKYSLYTRALRALDRHDKKVSKFFVEIMGVKGLSYKTKNPGVYFTFLTDQE